MGFSVASGMNSVAIGGDGVMYGPSNASGEGAVAIGGGSNATEIEAVAIGRKSKASGKESLALGANSSTGLANSVAIGAGSKAEAYTFNANQTSIILDGTTYKFAGKPSSDNGVFSIGNTKKERVLMNVAPGQISENSTDAINGSQLHATNQALESLSSQAVKYDVKDGKVDNTHITLAEGGTTISNVADTAIEEGSMNAVNGGSVYRETRVSRDGTYIRKENTAARNLEALDRQVSSNASSLYQLGNRVGELDSRMNKVGAGAAALAALHPLDFDPDDKWDFSAGVGNYKNATAAAVGLFYRPNERTLFNIGWTMGDNRNMVNGGFSVKLGKGSTYNGLSKAEMARTISLQSDEIKAIRADNEVKGKRIDALEEENRKIREENQEMKRQIQAIWERLGR